MIFTSGSFVAPRHTLPQAARESKPAARDSSGKEDRTDETDRTYSAGGDVDAGVQRSNKGLGPNGRNGPLEIPRSTDAGVKPAARKIRVDVPCRECGHSLRGIELSEECGNCHAPVAKSLRGDPERYLEPPAPMTPAEMLDENGHVRVDLPCRGCGYNVRTLVSAARCPECNTPVSRSCQGSLLRYSEPGYVGRLARGAYWVRQAIWLGVAGFVLFAAVPSFLRGVSATGMAWAVDAAFETFIAVLALLVLVGMWWITAPEPGASDLFQPKRTRQIVRGGLGATVLLAFLSFCIYRLPPLLPALAVLILGLALSISFAGLAIAYLRYLAELAQRFPEPEVARKARGTARGVLIAAGVLLAFKTVNVVAGPGTISLNSPGATSRAVGQPLALLTVVSCVGSIAVLALFVLSISTLRLQWRMCKSLRERAELARRNLGGEEARASCTSSS
jgi:Zn finger protein HypA/HybF involved in hydrogenase expression